ncbi:hypothetical protein GCM10010420_21250 [Streptomyces glaucosporus]|uniref:LPXTG cell wall anchor domain-containing protein n=1 Tax=Streptomyces glaucosporus TaxID=284044 RepID=A0ABN3I5R8_9ACTN
MRAHRRPLVTAAVAGGLLLGLWFVPSANATGEAGAADRPGASAAQVQGQTPAASGNAAPAGVELADTGSFDTTPYFVGGLGFLGAGAALLAHARIRSGREGLTPAVR